MSYLIRTYFVCLTGLITALPAGALSANGSTKSLEFTIPETCLPHYKGYGPDYSRIDESKRFIIEDFDSKVSDNRRWTAIKYIGKTETRSIPASYNHNYIYLDKNKQTMLFALPDYIDVRGFMAWEKMVYKIDLKTPKISTDLNFQKFAEKLFRTSEVHPSGTPVYVPVSEYDKTESLADGRRFGHEVSDFLVAKDGFSSQLKMVFARGPLREALLTIRLPSSFPPLEKFKNGELPAYNDLGSMEKGRYVSEILTSVSENGRWVVAGKMNSLILFDVTGAKRPRHFCTTAVNDFYQNSDWLKVMPNVTVSNDGNWILVREVGMPPFSMAAFRSFEIFNVARSKRYYFFPKNSSFEAVALTEDNKLLFNHDDLSPEQNETEFLHFSLLDLPSIETLSPVNENLPPIPKGPEIVTTQDLFKTVWRNQKEAFIKIPAGSFYMGSPPTEKDRRKDETLTLKTIEHDFEMQKTEVTQAQWMAVMESNPSFYMHTQERTCGGDFREVKSSSRSFIFGLCPDLPVNFVTWEKIQIFIQKLNELDKRYQYRLPTEVEWEYAARGGTSTAYSFGDEPRDCPPFELCREILVKYGWYSHNGTLNSPRKVGTLLPNPFGLYDMHGNVKEWTQDEYKSWNPYAPSARVVRGGGWDTYDSEDLRSAKRFGVVESNFDQDLGFRLVREPRRSNRR